MIIVPSIALEVLKKYTLASFSFYSIRYLHNLFLCRKLTDKRKTFENWNRIVRNGSSLFSMVGKNKRNRQNYLKVLSPHFKAK